MDTNQSVKLVEQKLAELGEHFEAVQILVSYPEDGGGTRYIARGAGNYFARQGMAHEFIDDEKAKNTAQEIGKVMDRPDDGDGWKG